MIMQPDHSSIEYSWRAAKNARIVITSEPGFGPGIDLFGQGTPNEGAEAALKRLIRDATEALAVWEYLKAQRPEEGSASIGGP